MDIEFMTRRSGSLWISLLVALAFVSLTTNIPVYGQGFRVLVYLTNYDTYTSSVTVAVFLPNGERQSYTIAPYQSPVAFGFFTPLPWNAPYRACVVNNDNGRSNCLDFLNIPADPESIMLPVPPKF